MMLKKGRLAGLIAAGLLLTSAQALAVDIPVKITGTVIIPDCKVAPKEIDWGDIQIQTLESTDTAYNIKQTSIDIECLPGLDNMKLTMTLRANQAPGGSSNYIATSKSGEGLAIAVRQGEYWTENNTVTLNTKENIAPAAVTNLGGGRKRLNLGFALVRLPGIGLEKLTPGRFDASANLEVRYE
ncbi:fimbrial protein [Escherichia coli]|nr:fimbrial protein [Escherichia coli]EFJ0493306.1 fimbrial protein [Escherichia coli]EFJ2843742.1 fimbrial protein [Escherichia coli]EFJ2912031.1 fimbrial protein [Escherichia coli]EFU2655986.1 fimbrial protein [Escherichia coli]